MKIEDYDKLIRLLDLIENKFEDKYEIMSECRRLQEALKSEKKITELVQKHFK